MTTGSSVILCLNKFKSSITPRFTLFGLTLSTNKAEYVAHKVSPNSSIYLSRVFLLDLALSGLSDMHIDHSVVSAANTTLDRQKVMPFLQ